MSQQLCRTRGHRLHILDGMKITPEIDDSPDFVRQVEQVVNGVICLHAPETLVLIKIDNYFGSKWLGFSGKALGALGVWHNPSYHRSEEHTSELQSLRHL